MHGVALGDEPLERTLNAFEGKARVVVTVPIFRECVTRMIRIAVGNGIVLVALNIEPYACADIDGLRASLD